MAAILSSKVLTTVGGLVLVPLYLAAWSPQQYGEWLALSAVVAHLATLDLGMNMGAINRLTRAYARGEMQDYRAAQRAALSFYLAVAAVASLLLAVVAGLAPIGEWLGLVELGASDAAWATWILGTVVVGSMVSGFVSATYRSTGDLATSQWIENAERALVLAATAAALVLGGGPVSLACLQLAILALVTVVVVHRLRGEHPDLVPAAAAWDWATLRSLLAPSLFFVLVTAGQALTLQGSVVLVATMLGGVAVAVFVTSRTLANVVRQLVNVLVISAWPEITRLDARGAVGTLRAAHSLLTVVTSAGCVVFGAALWWEGPDLITVWTRGALAADPTTLRLLLALLILQSPSLVSFVFVAAANRHAGVSIALFASSLIGVGVAVALVGPFGTAGVVAGLIVGDVLGCCHWVVRSGCRLVEEPYAPFARRVWSNLVFAALLALLAGWIAHVIVPGPLALRWLAVGSATTAVTGVTVWVLWLSADDRETLARRLRPLTAAASDVKA
jgi:O-antigen/teichoic acid export membrane protein